jgi:GIY-YIG catalytic domain
MALIYMIIFSMVVVGTLSLIDKIFSPSESKEDKIINERIRKGELFRLHSGVVKTPSELKFNELYVLPDFKYLVKYGEKYGYKNELVSIKINDRRNIHNSSELKEAADEVRKKISKENEILAIEYENRKKEEERRKIEELILKEELQRQGKWSRLSSSILCEIDKNNNKSSVSGIYVIHCTMDNRIYIGSSVNLLNRKSQHLNQLRNNAHHSHKLQEAFNELGESYFNFYLIELIGMNDLSYHSSDEKVNEISLKRLFKSREQDFLNTYQPDFNIETDARGKRHWKN